MWKKVSENRIEERGGGEEKLGEREIDPSFHSIEV